MARSNVDNRSNAQGSSQAMPNQPIASTPSMSTFHTGQVMGPHAIHTAPGKQMMCAGKRCAIANKTTASLGADYVPQRSNHDEAQQAYQTEPMLAEQQAKRYDSLGLPRQQTQNMAYSEWRGDASLPPLPPVAAQITGPTTHQYDGSASQAKSTSDLAMDGPALESFDFDKFLHPEGMGKLSLLSLSRHS